MLKNVRKILGGSMPNSSVKETSREILRRDKKFYGTTEKFYGKKLKKHALLKISQYDAEIGRYKNSQAKSKCFSKTEKP